MIRVIIADDHTILRKGLTQLLESFPDISVAGDVSSAPELLSKLAQTECDIIVLDITLPGRSGLEVLKQLRNEYSRIPILILSMHPEEQYAVRAIRSGAAGYLTKESAPEELIKAIRKICSGSKYVSESLAERLLIEVHNPSASDPHSLLSDREFEILCLIGSGYTLTGMAQKLSLSAKTVSTYRSRILLKMGMRNNAELTTYVIKKGLIQAP
jgi:two-component system, NarL family, invasion response regulator UvrY